MEHASIRPGIGSRTGVVSRCLPAVLAAVFALTTLLVPTAAASAHAQPGIGAGVGVGAGAGHAGSAPTQVARPAHTVADAGTAGGTAARSAAAAAVPCRDAYPIGKTGYIRYGGRVIASVKQYFSPRCRKNWGYVWVWQSFRNRRIPYDVGVAVYSYTTNRPYGNQYTANTRRAEFWSLAANTHSHCTAGQGLVLVNRATPAEEYSSKRC